MTRIFLLFSSKELWKWWRMALILLWCHSWLPSYSGFWFMQIRWLVTSQQGHKVVRNHKKLNISHDFFCIELKLRTVVTLITKFHDMSLCHFHCNTMGSRPSPFKGEKQSFSPSRSVICSFCSFSRCERIWILHSTSTRKSVKLWSNK